VATTVRLRSLSTQAVADCFFATHHLALSPLRHALLTIRNLTPRNTDRMFKHERDYSEENRFPRTAQESIREKDSDQRKVEEKLDHPPLVPRISPHLLCQGTQVGVRSRSTVFCDNRGDLILANSYSRRRIARVFPARTKLIVRVCSRRRGAGVNPIFQHWQRVKDNAFHMVFLVNAKISTASSSRLACWPCAKKCSSSKQSGN
jgi:hypothetical protein